jgi:hypothetical protein
MVTSDDPVVGPWPITADAVRESAEAICPAAHRHGGLATQPPCGDCWAKAESALRAGWRVIARELDRDPET